MKLANVRRIAREEIPEAPDWIDKLLTPLNQSIEQITQAISGQLTFADNMLCAIKTNTFSHGVELKVKNPLKSGAKPAGLLPFTANGVVGIDACRMTYQSSGDVGITFWFENGMPGDTSPVTYVLIGG